jgi:uncharacterized protein
MHRDVSQTRHIAGKETTMLQSQNKIEKEAKDQFDNSFDVPLPPAKAWSVLSDIQRIARCVPGAELTEVVDKTTYKGNISVPLGPVTLIFALQVKFDSIDPTNHTARVKAQGADEKGRGGAQCTVSFRLEPTGEGSKVLMHTDVIFSGAAAQYGRDVGVVQASAANIVSQFANNLRDQFTVGKAT